jgi:hypothetical protein
MCHLNWGLDDPGFYDEPFPTTRAFPQVKWAIPVDIAKLGASLEAYWRTLPQSTAVRLCHRYGSSALSQLPQEMLDNIINNLHNIETKQCSSKWDQHLRCFQGRCTRDQHVSAYDDSTEDLWLSVFAEGRGLDEEDLDPRDYTPGQKVAMIEEYMDENGNEYWDDNVYETHDESQNKWVELLCHCRETSLPQRGSKESSIPQFFGLRSVCCRRARCEQC